MTREEFIEALEQEGFRFEINGDRIIIYGGPYEWNPGFIDMEGITSIPDNVEFMNEGDLNLNSLTKIPKGTEFINSGEIFLDKVTSIHPDAIFNNSGKIFLIFRGKPMVDLTGRPEYINDFEIDGIDKRLIFNLMIRRGLLL